MRNTLSYRLLRHVVKDDKRGFILALLFSIFGGFVELAGVATIYPFLTLLNRPEIIHQKKPLEWLFASGRFASDRDFIFYFGILSALTFVFVNAFMFAKQAYLTRFSVARTAKISVRLLQNYLYRPYEFYLDHNSGEIGKNVISQADGVANSVLLSWMTAVSELFVLLSIALFILYFDFKTGLTVILVLGTIVGMIQYSIRKKVIELGRLNDEANSDRFSYCLEALQSIKEIKAAQKENFFCRIFKAPAQKFANSFSRANIVQILPSYAIQALAAVFVVGLALYYLKIGKPLPAILPLISLYAVAGYRLMPSLNRFSTAISQMRQYQVVFDNVAQILAAPIPAAAEPVVLGEPLQFTDKIQFKDVSFVYASSKSRDAVLDHLNFEIQANTFVAIAGGSGAGKTTLVDVLLGFFPPKEGEISIDGRRLTPDLMTQWRKLIGYIPQAIYLLDGTIADNIAFGVEETRRDWERVRKAARMAHLDDLVSELPDGFNARIGQRGAKFSGGERQRLAIARALYADPKILIMDEPTSALDGITEQGIVKTLIELKRDKTVIVIAHRNSTIRNSDKILLLDKGKIADSGPYDDLAKRNKHFAELMSHQQSGPSADDRT